MDDVTSGPTEVLANSPAETPPEAHDGRSRWRWVAALGLAAAALVALVVVLVTRGTGSTLPAHAPIGAVGGQGGVTVGGQELLAVLAKGQQTTFHATYAVVGDPTAIGGTMTLEIWQQPPNLREDTIVARDGQTVRTESIADATKGSVCVQQGTAPLSCQPIPADQVGALRSSRFLSSITTTLSGHSVTRTSRTIDGRTVTCFQVQAGERPSVCLTRSGIPVLIETAQVSYRLRSLDLTVDGNALLVPGS